MSDPMPTTLAPAPSDIAAVRLGLLIPADKADAFSDDLISGFIASYPVNDSLGRKPSDFAWAGKFDLNAATADLWSLIAVCLSDLYDFEADTAKFSRSQLFANAMRMRRHFNSRRYATSTPISRDRQTDILYQGRWPFAAERDLNLYETLQSYTYPSGTSQGEAL